MFTYIAKSLNLGFLGDCHNDCAKIDVIRAKHPEIEQWFFGGDLFDFQYTKYNDETAKWLEVNIDKYIFVKGNHDSVVSNKLLNIDFYAAFLIKTKFEKGVKIILPNSQELLLYHSKAGDFWEFVEENYTERELVDDYPIKDNTRAVIIFHNHKCFKKNFVDTDAEIWSIGAMKDGRYAILNSNGIQFKKL